MSTTQPHHPNTSALPVRFVTAASLFDGHDASINIMRRILQDRGAEVIHLGHDRSAREVVEAAIQEDAHGIAVSSYQGGHMEYFTYMVDLLKEAGRSEIKVFGGGGGTITDKEIEELHKRGVTHIYSVEDGRRMGLIGMIDHMIEGARREVSLEVSLDVGSVRCVAQGIATALPRDPLRALGRGGSATLRAPLQQAQPPPQGAQRSTPRAHLRRAWLRLEL